MVSGRFLTALELQLERFRNFSCKLRAQRFHSSSTHTDTVASLAACQLATCTMSLKKVGSGRNHLRILLLIDSHLTAVTQLCCTELPNPTAGHRIRPTV